MIIKSDKKLYTSNYKIFFDRFSLFVVGTELYTQTDS